MANIETAIYELLTSESSITDMVGDRIFPSSKLENYPSPYIQYFLIGGGRERPMEGRSNCMRPIFKFICYAKTQLEVVALADNLIALLEGYTGTLNGIDIMDGVIKVEGDLTIDQFSGVKARTVDIEIWYARS